MYCIFLILSLVLSSNASDFQINITKDYELEEFLCSGTQLLNDTTVKLSTNISHIIRNASFCIINTTYSLSIISNSSQQAVIQCNDSIIQPTSGLAFTNIPHLILQKLVFKGCGGYLKRLDAMKLINSTDSPLKFSRNQSAVLLFLYIDNLLINAVNITNYCGFALFAINPLSASIFHSNISHSYGSKNSFGFGSGIILFFTDINYVQQNAHLKVFINHTAFNNNKEYSHESLQCFYKLKWNADHLPMANAAGLSVFYTQNNFNAEVYVSQSSFISNRGTLAGAVLVMYFNSVTQSQTVISSTFFDQNTNKMSTNLYTCPGSCVSFFIHLRDKTYHNVESSKLYPLTIFNCSFTPDRLHYYASWGLIRTYFVNPMKVTVVRLKKINFTSIEIAGTGTCLYAEGINNLKKYRAQVIMENISAERNRRRNNAFTHSNRLSLFAIQNIGTLFLVGSNIFTDNFGSVFYVKNSKIVLDGLLHFMNNFAYFGSAFHVVDSSWFILNDSLIAKFIGNSAMTTGGAIYASINQKTECMFTTKGSNISMLFYNNTASYSGSSILSNQLYKCKAGQSDIDLSNASLFYHNISNGTLDRGLSTVVNKLCICWQQNSSNCTESLDGTIVYPGMKLHFPMAALDVFNQVTFAEISMLLLTNSSSQDNNATLSNFE